MVTSGRPRETGRWRVDGGCGPRRVLTRGSGFPKPPAFLPSAALRGNRNTRNHCAANSWPGSPGPQEDSGPERGVTAALGASLRAVPLSLCPPQCFSENSDGERQTPCGFMYMWNLKPKQNQPNQTTPDSEEGRPQGRLPEGTGEGERCKGEGEHSP